MKVLITGGAGFIGSHLVDRYLSQGFQVVVIDNFSTGKVENKNKDARYYQADIIDSKSVAKIVAQEKPDIINHHAAQISVRAAFENPIDDANININGGLNLLEAARKNNVKKIIFASSGGAISSDPTRDTEGRNLPDTPYGLSKLCFEKYLQFYYDTYGLEYAALRYSNVYGPRQRNDGEGGVISIFINNALSAKPLIINGDGEQTRDFIYVDDVVEANIIATKYPVNGILNIGTEKETNIKKLSNLISDCLERPIAHKHGPAIPGEQKRSCLDCKKSYKQLNWKPQVKLQQGIKMTIDYFSKHAEITQRAIINKF